MCSSLTLYEPYSQEFAARSQKEAEKKLADSVRRSKEVSDLFEVRLHTRLHLEYVRKYRHLFILRLDRKN